MKISKCTCQKISRGRFSGMVTVRIGVIKNCPVHDIRWSGKKNKKTSKKKK